MIDFLIFAVTFVTVLLIAVFYLYPGSRRSGTTIPGMDPSDPKEGNIPDIIVAGSLHEFLTTLHEKYGPIASFWLETQLVVSLASPELFQQHQHAFDRPVELFNILNPILGGSNLFFPNGAQGRYRHKAYLELLTQISQEEMFSNCVSEITLELAHKLESISPDQHIPLHQYMMALTWKGLLQILFGKFKNDQAAFELRRQYEILYLDLESKLLGKETEPDGAKEKVHNALQYVHDTVKESLGSLSSKDGGCLASTFKKLALSEEQQLDDALTILHRGFHALGNLLTWTFCFLATHDNVQQKLHKEVANLQDKLPEKLSSSYLQRVVNEALRRSAVVSHASRCEDIDVEIGGHIIPKNTPIIHALGVVLNDSTHWPLTNTFDPERFSEEISQGRHPLSFCPWGFAGKRSCPSEKMAYNFIAMVVTIMVKRFHFKLVEDQVVTPVYGLTTKPEDEIWVCISKWT